MGALERGSFAVKCQQCQARLKVREEDLGQERTCPRCHHRFLLPGREEADRLTRIQHARAEYSFRCRLCGTLMYAHPSQQGESLPCPDCDTPNPVPPPPPPVVRPPTPAEDEDMYRLQEDDLPPTRTAEARRLVRVRCPTCDALMYARPDQVGMLIPCVDCGKAVRVPQPPPTDQRPPVASADVLIEIEPTFERVVEAESHEKTWAAADEWAEKHRAKLPKPPRRPYLDGTYTFPFYREILPRWLGLTVLWLPMVPFCIFADEAKGLEMVILIPLFIAMTPLIILLVFFVASMLMAVVARTAMGYDHIDEWPRLDIFERILNLLVPTSAFIIATAPWAILKPLSVPWWMVLLIQLVSAYCFFPVVFLSLCENNSLAMPYHRAIWQSLRQHSRPWGAFYLAAAPAFAPLLVWAVFATCWPNPWIVALTFTFWLLTMLIYFRLLGRLAWQINRLLPEEAKAE